VLAGIGPSPTVPTIRRYPAITQLPDLGFILRGLIDGARARGATSVIGEYLPTAKNGVVTELYPGLGFSQADGAFFTRDLVASTEDLITHIAAA